jgi:hypothetical protein
MIAKPAPRLWALNRYRKRDPGERWFLLDQAAAFQRAADAIAPPQPRSKFFLIGSIVYSVAALRVWTHNLI